MIIDLAEGREVTASPISEITILRYSEEIVMDESRILTTSENLM
jgi:hypothetical protein